MRELVITFLKNLSDVMIENRDYLINLDSVVGDGDLGLTMSDGFWAAYQAAAASDETDIGKLLYQAGKAMSAAVPSTMGTLMASGWMQCGKALRGKTELTATDYLTLFTAYEEGVQNRGKAEIGDKTFLDSWHPAVEAFANAVLAEKPLATAALAAYEAAKAGFELTTTMLAVHGRAATRGESSKSLKDPGAAVAMLMMQAFVLTQLPRS